VNPCHQAIFAAADFATFDLRRFLRTAEEKLELKIERNPYVAATGAGWVSLPPKFSTRNCSVSGFAKTLKIARNRLRWDLRESLRSARLVLASGLAGSA
jgi:hypothetical protein